MISDNERREVAKALREANFYMSYRSKRDMWDELRRIVGEYRDTPFGGVYTFARLADLIDPDTTTNTTKSPELTTKCDRKALLELVKELELGAQCVVGRKWPNMECERMAKNLADDYDMIVCRIRKALGVEDGS